MPAKGPGNAPELPEALAPRRRCRDLARGVRLRRSDLWSGWFGLHEPKQPPQLAIKLRARVGVVFQELAGVLAALPDPLTFITKPRTALFHEVLCDAEVDQVAFFGDPFPVDDVEFGLAEGRRDLILDHLHLGAVADHDVAIFDRG